MFLEILLFSTLAILVGLSFCFLGYPFFRILLPIWGFFAGTMAGISGMSALLGEGFLASSIAIFVGFAIGVVFAALSYFFYKFAVILFGAFLGYTMGAGILLWFGVDSSFLITLSGLFLSVVFVIGFIGLKIPRMLIMFATAFGGATAVITGIFVLFGKLPPDMVSFDLAKYTIGNSFLWLVAWLVLGSIGAAAQYAMKQEADDLSQTFVVVEEPTPTPTPAS